MRLSNAAEEREGRLHEKYRTGRAYVERDTIKQKRDNHAPKQVATESPDEQHTRSGQVQEFRSAEGTGARSLATRASPSWEAKNPHS